jgi:hypothetical protein
MLGTGNPCTVAHALQGVPSSSRVHRTAQSLLHPLGDFRPTPKPTIGWWVLENLCKLDLLLHRKQGLISDDLMAMISYTPLSLLIPPLDDGTDPPGAVTKLFSDFPWRLALLDLPQNVPMGPFYHILTLSIPLLKLFLCQVCLHFYSFYHIPILHYSGGFGIRMCRERRKVADRKKENEKRATHDL